MKKMFMFLFVMIIVIFPLTIKASEEENNELFDITSKSAVLIEPKTGKIIYEKNGYEKLAPASMTKLMTMLLVCEALENGVIEKNQMLTASKYATSMGGTQIYLKENEQMCVDDLLKSVALASANDAAVVLAEGIAGSCDSFVKMMNEKGKEIGLKNTNFKNPNGLPAENHYSCAVDMGLIGAYLLNKYEEIIIPYTSLYEDYVREDLENKFWLVNTNKLVKHVPGVDGLKTGWTEEAGYCLTCTMKKNDVRMVSVVMGAESIDERTNDSLELLNYGISNYKIEKIYSKNDLIETIEDVTKKPNIYHIVVKDDVFVLLKKNDRVEDFEIEKKIDYSDIGKKENPGKLIIKMDKNNIIEVDLLVYENVKKANIFMIIFEVLKEIFLIT